MTFSHLAMLCECVTAASGPLVFIESRSNAVELDFTARCKVRHHSAYFERSATCQSRLSMLGDAQSQLANEDARFHRGDRGAILKAELMDSLEIHCPLYNDSVMLTSAEYSIIYMVSEYGYQNCVMDEERPVGHCYSPYKETILRLVIREFTPIPNGLEFEPGQTYYFISTSDGSMNGVHNRLGGLCASANMRFQIHVSDKASSHLNANSERVPLPPRELEDRTVAHSTVWPLKSIDSNQLPRTDESLSLPLAAKSPMEDLEQELPSHLSIYQLDRQLPPYTGEEDLSDPWRHHPRRPPLILYEIHEMLSPEDQAIGAYPAPSGAASQRLIQWAIVLCSLALVLLRLQ